MGRSRWVRLGLATLLIGGVAWCRPVAADAVTDVITATPTPSAVSLVPGGSATGVLVLANTAWATVGVQVAAAAGDGSVIVELPIAGATLPAGGSVALPFTVRRAGEGSDQQVVVRFVVSVAAPVASVSVATVTVTPAKSPTLVEASVESKSDTINENQPGQGFLVLSDPRDAAVQVTGIDVGPATSTTVTVTCPGGQQVVAQVGAVQRGGCAFEIPPLEQLVLPVQFATDRTVVPGNRSVTFRVLAADPVTGQHDSVVATAAFTVQVFAASDLLNAIGVPTLLVVPGVIVVLVSWFLFRTVGPWRGVARNVTPQSVVSATTTTAILGVAVSLVMAQLYPLLTSTFVPRVRRDYLTAYGFVDFYYVFGYSFVIAILFWGLSSLAWPAFRAALIPSAGDKERGLLRKIALRGLFGGGSSFRKVTGAASGVVLGRRGSDEVLVAPRIVVEIEDDDLAADQVFRLWRRVVRAKAKVRYKDRDVGKPVVVKSSDVSGEQRVPIVQFADPP